MLPKPLETSEWFPGRAQPVQSPVLRIRLRFSCEDVSHPECSGSEHILADDFVLANIRYLTPDIKEYIIVIVYVRPAGPRVPRYPSSRTKSRDNSLQNSTILRCLSTAGVEWQPSDEWQNVDRDTRGQHAATSKSTWIDAATPTKTYMSSNKNPVFFFGDSRAVFRFVQTLSHISRLHTYSAPAIPERIAICNSCRHRNTILFYHNHF